MERFKSSSMIRIISTIFLSGILFWGVSPSAHAQCLAYEYGTSNAGQAYSRCQLECGNSWQYCYVYNVVTGTFKVYTNANQTNLKVTKSGQAVTAADVAKMPGMSKFKPFAGNDDVAMAIGPKLLIYQGHDGGATERQLDLCQQNDTDPCKQSATWSITKDKEADTDVFYIQPGDDKKTYLCFNPETGISLYRNPSRVDECTQWQIIPAQLGEDGEITTYKIIPKKHPEYVLSADTRSNQIIIPKINTKHGEVTEPEMTQISNWTLSVNKTKVTSQKERVVGNAEEK